MRRGDQDCTSTVQIEPSLSRKPDDRPDIVWSGPCETSDEAIKWGFINAKDLIDTVFQTAKKK
jgi:hypothetical protein